MTKEEMIASITGAISNDAIVMQVMRQAIIKYLHSIDEAQLAVIMTQLNLPQE